MLGNKTFKVVSVNAKTKEERIIAQWGRVTDSVAWSCVNFAEGYVRALSDSHTETFNTPCVKQLDGYLWYNNKRTIKCVDETGNILSHLK